MIEIADVAEVNVDVDTVSQLAVDDAVLYVKHTIIK